tara:strand:+ start:771 stop:992 length:222 start_codon:yes stop_codon:yes gene_type:complete
MSTFVKKTLQKIIEEFNDEDNKKKIYDDVVTPIIEKFTEKIYPYVTLLFVMYSINLILIIAILLIIIMTRNVK